MATTITFNGVTHRPNNATSPDGDLAICLNLVNDNGTLTPLEQPTPLFSIPNNLQALFIHNNSLYKNLICYDTENKQIIWFDYYKLQELGEVDYGESNSWGIILNECNETPTVATLGNTLIFTFKEQPIKYAVWKNNAYTALGSRPPFVQMKTGLLDTANFVSYVNLPTGIDTFMPKSIATESDGGYTIEFPDDIAEKISTSIMSTANQFITTYTKQGKFIFPFILRYALRLYDGSLIQHSFPVLMIPNSYLVASFSGNNPIDFTNISYSKLDYSQITECSIAPFLADLGTQILDVPAELTDWKDLVQSLDIFISAPIYTYKQSGKVSKISYNRDSGENSRFGVFATIANERKSTFQSIFHLPRKDDDELQDAVESCSIFYKIHTIPFDAIKKQSDYTKIAIDGDKLATITSQEVMTDEYNSHQNTIAQSSFVYNNRINLANITQEIIADVIGSTQINSAIEAYKRFDLFTTISANNQSYTLQHPREYAKDDIYGYDGNPYSAFPRYIFYPHTGASNTIFRSTVDKIAYDMPMKAHSGLNGAVYFRGFGDVMPKIRENYDSLPVISNKIDEVFTNKLYTSDVDNPFVFRPANINTIGSGNIRALGAATTPLSQGQFGAFPLYAFTDEGVWALAVSDTGGWSSIQPVTRDVITEGTTPLNLDSALVFFTSRGLMLLEGSSVLCISALLDNSLPIELPHKLVTSISNQDLPFFTQFPQKAPLAYDYTHSRIYVLSPYVAWIYSLKSRTWTHALNGELGAEVINDYPTTVLVPANNYTQKVLFALNEDCKHYNTAEVLTRPLKFGSNSLRTLRSVITRGQLQGNLQSVLYASRDNEQFIPIASSGTHYIRRTSGSPYHSHCLHILANNIDDRFAINSAEFDITIKHTNKLR